MAASGRDRDHDQRDQQLQPVAAEEQSEVVAVPLEDRGAQRREIVAHHEVGEGEVEDRQHREPDAEIGEARRQQELVGRIGGVEPPRHRQPEAPDDDGEKADGAGREQRQLGEAALDRIERDAAREVVGDRTEQPARHGPVDDQQADHAHADGTPGVRPGARQEHEGDGDREVEGEDRRRHQHVAALQGAGFGGGDHGAVSILYTTTSPS